MHAGTIFDICTKIINDPETPPKIKDEVTMIMHLVEDDEFYSPMEEDGDFLEGATACTKDPEECEGCQ